MTIAGFTGTQGGMTELQRSTYAMLLIALTVTELQHGDCIGADADAHDLARTVPAIHITARPCTIRSKRAFKTADVTFPPKAPLDRNTDIVSASDLLIATPGEFAEVMRSGTWSTIRRARKRKIPLYIIWPDGTIRAENAHE
jgi:hypothetical protein